MADTNTRPPQSAGQETLVHTRRSSLTSKSDHTISHSSHESDNLEKKSSSAIDPDVERGIPIINTTEDADINEKSNITRIVSVSDSNIVDWNDKDDPRRPINWPNGKKWKNCAVISILTFLTPLASSMVAPVVPGLMRDFKSNDSTLASFTVSIYLLGYVVGPLFIAPLSEMYGRMPVYHVCNVMFVIWNMACALAPSSSIGSFFVFRLFAGIAGSCPITIFAGSIADVFIQEKRGGAMAICALGPLIGKQTYTGYTGIQLY